MIAYVPTDIDSMPRGGGGLPFTVIPMMHDGVISSLRAYSPSAWLTLANYADPAIDITMRGGTVLNRSFRPLPQIAVATRTGSPQAGRLRGAQ